MLLRSACASLLLAVACARQVPPPPLLSGDLPAIVPGQTAIQGRVHDVTTGVPIAGALVILQCECMAGHREMQTDPRGVYSFVDLQPGRYVVQVLAERANVNKTAELPAGRRVVVQFAVDPDHHFRIEVG
jgi:hypothetical protein